MLSRYGALGVLLTDQGREFMCKFRTLLAQHEITHRVASRKHPQSDWLAERKRRSSLRRHLVPWRTDWEGETSRIVSAPDQTTPSAFWTVAARIGTCCCHMWLWVTGCQKKNRRPHHLLVDVWHGSDVSKHTSATSRRGVGSTGYT